MKGLLLLPEFRRLTRRDTPKITNRPLSDQPRAVKRPPLLVFDLEKTVALDRVRFDKAQMKKVDLRDATGLGITDGIDALKGATISSTQLLDLAPMFAQALGVTVKDR